MSRKTLGIVLIVVGVVGVIVSLGADAIGIGNNVGIGWKQALGAVAGVIIVAVGAWYWPGFPESRMMGEAASARPTKTQRPAAPVKKTRASRKARKTTKRRK